MKLLRKKPGEVNKLTKISNGRSIKYTKFFDNSPSFIFPFCMQSKTKKAENVDMNDVCSPRHSETDKIINSTLYQIQEPFIFKKRPQLRQHIKKYQINRSRRLLEHRQHCIMLTLSLIEICCRWPQKDGGGEEAHNRSTNNKEDTMTTYNQNSKS